MQPVREETTGEKIKHGVKHALGLDKKHHAQTAEHEVIHPSAVGVAEREHVQPIGVAPVAAVPVGVAQTAAVVQEPATVEKLPAEFVQEPAMFVKEATEVRVGEGGVVKEAPLVYGSAEVAEREIVHEKPVVIEKPIVREKEIITERPILHEQEVVQQIQPIIKEKHVTIEQPVVREQETLIEKPVERDVHAFQQIGRTEVLPTQVERIDLGVQQANIATEVLPPRVERMDVIRESGTLPAAGLPATGFVSTDVSGTTFPAHTHPTLGSEIKSAAEHPLLTAEQAIKHPIKTAEHMASAATGTLLHPSAQLAGQQHMPDSELLGKEKAAPVISAGAIPVAGVATKGSREVPVTTPLGVINPEPIAGAPLGVSMPATQVTPGGFVEEIPPKRL